jgi:hypothetical protein
VKHTTYTLTRVATSQAKADATDMLNSWSNNISELLGKVEKTCHLIHKESMIHGTSAKPAPKPVLPPANE